MFDFIKQVGFELGDHTWYWALYSFVIDPPKWKTLLRTVVHFCSSITYCQKPTCSKIEHLNLIFFLYSLSQEWTNTQYK